MQSEFVARKQSLHYFSDLAGLVMSILWQLISFIIILWAFNVSNSLGRTSASSSSACLPTICVHVISTCPLFSQHLFRNYLKGTDRLLQHQTCIDTASRHSIEHKYMRFIYWPIQWPYMQISGKFGAGIYITTFHHMYLEYGEAAAKWLTCWGEEQCAS